ncbi:enoyl-CoA hydratase-related protein [Streptomyces shenzhenensis]|uniref:enoyl-CoA hydratase-related protein n=1 Tax=Streptomyces shenzhenensis TaxID=943815 RepID=UPI00340EB0F2
MISPSARVFAEAGVELWLTPPLAEIRLLDHDNHNRMVPPFQAAAEHAFREATRFPRTRVVLVTGLSTAFCAGAAPEELLAENGAAISDAFSFIRCPLMCPLPVVSAVSGPAVGGGFLFALYTDLPVLNQHASYAANFMSYGFVPAMGAAQLLTTKLGYLLGTEMLFTGRPYRGAELHARVPGLSVVPAAQVEETARHTALRIARAPRRSLELLKSRMAKPLRQTSDNTKEEELAGLQETLRNPEVRARINRLYAQQWRGMHVGPTSDSSP